MQRSSENNALFCFGFPLIHHIIIKSLICYWFVFEVFLCHPRSNHTKSGIVVTPEAVACNNRTDIVWPQRGPWQRNIIAPNKAPEHVVSRSAVLLLSDRDDHKVMRIIKAKTCWRFSERLHWFNVLSSFFIYYLTWILFTPQWLIWSEFVLWVAVMTLNLIGCLAWWK